MADDGWRSDGIAGVADDGPSASVRLFRERAGMVSYNMSSDVAESAPRPFGCGASAALVLPTLYTSP